VNSSIVSLKKVVIEPEGLSGRDIIYNIIFYPLLNLDPNPYIYTFIIERLIKTQV